MKPLTTCNTCQFLVLDFINLDHNVIYDCLLNENKYFPIVKKRNTISVIPYNCKFYKESYTYITLYKDKRKLTVINNENVTKLITLSPEIVKIFNERIRNTKYVENIKN